MDPNRANRVDPLRSDSERVPGRSLGVFQIAHIGSEPKADAGAKSDEARSLALLQALVPEYHATVPDAAQTTTLRAPCSSEIHPRCLESPRVDR